MTWGEHQMLASGQSSGAVQAPRATASADDRPWRLITALPTELVPRSAVGPSIRDPCPRNRCRVIPGGIHGLLRSARRAPATRRRRQDSRPSRRFRVPRAAPPAHRPGQGRGRPAGQRRPPGRPGRHRQGPQQVGPGQGRRRRQAGRLRRQADRRADQRDAKLAAGQADEAEADAADAIEFAAWTVDHARLAVLDAIDARASADDLASSTAT